MRPATISIRENSRPMMRNEKAGGHSERSIASAPSRSRYGTRWRRSRTSRCIACSRSATTAARCQTECSAMSAAAGTGPGKTIKDLQDEMRRHLDAGYTMVKMKVGGAPLDEDLRRIEAVKSLPAGATISRSTPTRNSARRSVAPTPRRSRPSSCAGSKSPAIRSISRCLLRSRRSTTRRSRPAKTCSRPRTSKTWCALAASGRARRDPDRPAAGLRHRAIRPHGRRCWRATAGRARCSFPMAATRCRSPSPPASASAARNPIPACSATSVVLPTTPHRGRHDLAFRPPRHRLRGTGPLYRIMRELACI